MNKQALIVLAALIAGLLLGPMAERAVPGVGVWAGVVGDMWLNGLKMTVIPLIVALLITGIVKAAQMARAGQPIAPLPRRPRRTGRQVYS